MCSDLSTLNRFSALNKAPRVVAENATDGSSVVGQSFADSELHRSFTRHH
jgi:hypothetical protein